MNRKGAKDAKKTYNIFKKLCGPGVLRERSERAVLAFACFY